MAWLRSCGILAGRDRPRISRGKEEREEEIIKRKAKAGRGGRIRNKSFI